MLNNFSYKIYGSGQPVVLIPGFASKINSWGFQYRWLKKYYKIIAIENSLGMAGQSKDGCEIANIASDISDILNSLSIEKTAMLGSSMGAMIALDFAQRYPDKISSLILASFPIEHTPSLRDLTEDLHLPTQNSLGSDSFSKNFLEVFFSPDFVKQDRFKIFTDFFMQSGPSFPKGVLSAQLGAVSEWLESKRWLQGCNCPCLFIYGSEDQLISKENTIKEVATVFNKSEVKIINGAGHAVHIEKYQEFNNIVHEFLNGHSL